MSETTKTALQQFDSLPDSARVRLPVVVALTASSPATVWRASKDGRLPAPVKVGGITSWRVGDLRKALSQRAE